MLLRDLVYGLSLTLAPVTSEHQREARLFAAAFARLSLGELNLHLTDPCPAGAEAWAAEVVHRRQLGEPLQYILGSEEFMSLPFMVNPAVLIPRSDTECVVERALALLQTWPTPPRVADIGTGSGAIAVSIAYYCPAGLVQAVDISPAALAVAQQNALANGVASRIVFLQGDLCAPLTGELDMILANPPYVSQEDFAAVAPEVRQEPALALYGGVDGLDVYRRLIPEAYAALAHGGILLLETGADQEGAVSALCRQAGFGEPCSGRDLRGRHRYVEGKKA